MAKPEQCLVPRPYLGLIELNSPLKWSLIEHNRAEFGLPSDTKGAQRETAKPKFPANFPCRKSKQFHRRASAGVQGERISGAPESD